MCPHLDKLSADISQNGYGSLSLHVSYSICHSSSALSTEHSLRMFAVKPHMGVNNIRLDAPRLVLPAGLRPTTSDPSHTPRDTKGS
eukprot:6477838-Amphidinium_carterae.2